MLKLRLATSNPEELFVERYEQMLDWALHLCGGDETVAKDLLHDVFILFTLNQPNLASIENLEGYLYAMLRNLHLSQVRKATRTPLQQLSIVEYDSAEAGLLRLKAYDRIQAQDELRRVCHYACTRKQQAKAASVLILRFFHGYYPSEIAEIVKTSCQAVNVRLMMARSEAKLTLESPRTIGFLKDSAIPELLPANFARSTDDFLHELCRTIYASCRGECLSLRQLKKIYQPGSDAQIECESLAHIVSCPRCLDEVNRLLHLPLLAERYPTDTLGRETRKKGGPGGGATGGGISGSLMSKWRRRAKGVFEHWPKELCVSVNGYVQGSQRINSERSELNLVIDLAEPISFIEVFSEQETRLLLLNVEPPPVGSGEQSLKVTLSNGRSLELTLRFRSPWPAVQLVYHDPAFINTEAGVLTATAEAGNLQPHVQGAQFEIEATVGTKRRELENTNLPGQQSLWARFRSRFDSKLQRLDWRLFLRPGSVTAILAAVLLGAFLFVETRRPVPPLAAADLLRQSAVTEENMATRTDQIAHRAINLEERQVDCGSRIADCGFNSSASVGQLISRRKIEIWQSGEMGITARRLYDDRGALLAGEWTRSDNVSTLYHHGAKPQLQIRNPQSAIRNLDDVWQLEPSAKEFSQLIGNAQGAKVEELSSTYLIRYASEADVDAGGLVRASLVLSKSELHATELTVVVHAEDPNSQSAMRGPQTGSPAGVLVRNPQFVEYRFVEVSFERHAPDSVASRVFDPDPEFISERIEDEGGRMNKKTESVSPLTLSPFPPAASPELEVEVLRLLNQVGAFFGEQLSLTRTPQGVLRVEGIVDTEQRKSEILRALGPVASNPAVRVEIETVSEAVNRQKPAAPGAVIVQQLAAPRATITVDSELRQYFSGKRGLSGEQLDQEMRRFADQMISRSRQARRHALALKQIAERFSSDDLRTLSPEVRLRWHALLSEHAQAFRLETAELLRELQPIFASGRASAEAPTETDNIESDADFARAARRLFDLASASDDTIRTAFSISDESSSATRIRSPQFWGTLKFAEALATKIASSQ